MISSNESESNDLLEFKKQINEMIDLRLEEIKDSTISKKKYILMQVHNYFIRMKNIYQSQFSYSDETTNDHPDDDDNYINDDDNDINNDNDEFEILSDIRSEPDEYQLIVESECQNYNNENDVRKKILGLSDKDEFSKYESSNSDDHPNNTDHNIYNSNIHNTIDDDYLNHNIINMVKYIPPSLDSNAFHCPNCGVYAHQDFYYVAYGKFT